MCQDSAFQNDHYFLSYTKTIHSHCAIGIQRKLQATACFPRQIYLFDTETISSYVGNCRGLVVMNNLDCFTLIKYILARYCQCIPAPANGCPDVARGGLYNLKLILHSQTISKCARKKFLVQGSSSIIGVAPALVVFSCSTLPRPPCLFHRAFTFAVEALLSSFVTQMQ